MSARRDPARALTRGNEHDMTPRTRLRAGGSARGSEPRARAACTPHRQAQAAAHAQRESTHNCDTTPRARTRVAWQLPNADSARQPHARRAGTLRGTCTHVQHGLTHHRVGARTCEPLCRIVVRPHSRRPPPPPPLPPAMPPPAPAPHERLGERGAQGSNLLPAAGDADAGRPRHGPAAAAGTRSSSAQTA